MGTQHEVKDKQPLLGADGVITEPGWARYPVWEYNRENIAASPLRIKEWDYYLAAGEDFALAFTISDLGFAGMASVSLIELSKRKETTKTELSAFPMGNMHMGRSSDDGRAVFQNRNVRLEYDARPGEREIKCVFKNFRDGQKLKAHLIMEQPDQETMCIATPWAEKKTAFYYNQKINNMPVKGYAKLGDRTYALDPARDMAMLDWGRGVWTYDNIWYWATCSTRLCGVPFGFNLGYGFSDRSSASENMIFYDGKVHKLGEIEIIIPEDENWKKQFLNEWMITSDDGRFEASFTPILDRQAEINLGVIDSDQHQIFGRIHGTAVLDDGTKIPMKNMLTAIEYIHNRY